MQILRENSTFEQDYLEGGLPNDVLLNLYGELEGIGGVWRTAAATESNQGLQSRWQHMAEFHLGLAGEVVTKLLERAVR